MTIHVLKCSEYFESLVDGSKTLELRRNDRGYQVGDILQEREWDPATERYTGRKVEVEVTHIVEGTEHLAHGYCGMSVKRLF
jgi:hypothetical protein